MGNTRYIIMNDKVKKEVEIIIEEYDLNCSIEEFKDKVSWESVCIWQKLSEDFMREFKDKIHWKFISVYQKLSEKFIREFINKLHWNNITYCQKLSKNFIRELRHKLDLDCLLDHNKITKEEFDRLECLNRKKVKRWEILDI